MITTRWCLCVTMETSPFAVEDVYTELVIDVFYIFNSTVIDWTCFISFIYLFFIYFIYLFHLSYEPFISLHLTSLHFTSLCYSAVTLTVRSRTAHEGPDWGAQVQLNPFFNLGDRLCGWPTSFPGRFTRRTERERRLGGPHGRSGRVRKNLFSHRDSIPPADQPVASRYNDWAIAAHPSTCFISKTASWIHWNLALGIAGVKLRLTINLSLISHQWFLLSCCAAAQRGSAPPHSSGF